MISVKLRTNHTSDAPSIPENSIPDQSSNTTFPVILPRQFSTSSQSTESDESQDDFIGVQVCSNLVNDPTDETIIDGVVVKSNELNEIGKVGLVSYVFFFTLLIMVIVAFTVKHEDNVSDSPEPLNGVLNFDYEAYAREIAISVSGQEKVDDQHSTHHWAYRTIAEELPRLLNNTEPTKYTDKFITQRYVVGVVFMEGLYNKEYYKALLQEHRYGRICEHYLCNENDEVLLIERRNLMYTTKRGNILATEIGHLISLNYLILRRSGFSGTIPTEVGNLRDLQLLDISGNFFTGSIPTEIGLLDKLELFIFSSNSLDGNIPTELNNLPNLVVFDVSNNNFTGVIPPLKSSRKSLIKLDFRNNNFSEGIGSFCNFDPSGEQSYSLHIPYGLDPVSYEISPDFLPDCMDNQTEHECDCN